MVITKELVEKYILQRAYDCSEHKNFRISRNENRLENDTFIRDYNLNQDRQAKMIKELVYKDLSRIDSDINNEEETVYVFGKKYKLFHIERGEEEVETYIKFVFKERRNAEMMVIVSFHEANKPIEYYFKDERDKK